MTEGDIIVDITADSVRKNLLDRANAFCGRHGYSFSRIGEEALNDSKFLAHVQRGGNFTIKTYQRVLDWMDAVDRSEGAAA